MLGAVERGAGHLDHAGVELGEEVPVRSGVDHVDAAGDDGPGVGDEVRAGLDLETERAAGLSLEGDERLLHQRADGDDIRRLLAGNAGNLEAAAEAHRGYVG